MTNILNGLLYNKITPLLIGLALIILFILYNNNKHNLLEGFLYIQDSKLYNETNEKDKPTEIKYQIPVPANQLTDLQLQDLDTDILRNVRPIANFSKTDELDFYQIYNIIKQLRDVKYNFAFTTSKDGSDGKSYLASTELNIELTSGAIKNVDLELFTRVKLELISAFNRLILDNNYYVKYHAFDFFKIINSNLISTTDLDNGTINWVFTLKIGREGKYQQITLYYDLNLIKNNIDEYEVQVNKVEVLGLPVPKDIKFHENKKTSDKRNTYIDTHDTDVDVMPFGDGKNFQSPDIKFIDPVEIYDMSPNYFNNDSLSSKVEERITNLAKDVYSNSHKCFALVDGKSMELEEYKWQMFCESYHPEVNQNGIWDAPCQIDSDCPFYKANKNYPNNFGKCDKPTGKCEMPQGVTPIGFTKYAKREPDCYNCGMDSISNKCCSQQSKLVSEGKVGYKSPDFIFKDDFTARKQNANLIKSQGLHVNPSI
jgi:hypothetical protein